METTGKKEGEERVRSGQDASILTGVSPSGYTFIINWQSEGGGAPKGGRAANWEKRSFERGGRIGGRGEEELGVLRWGRVVHGTETRVKTTLGVPIRVVGVLISKYTSRAEVTVTQTR